ncbi:MULTISPECIES: DUF6192 family protein [Streptomyces]|uniref:DUF6192 family protein n=1 Tax=Streptomyces TaxID=1883 RepID=UPI0029BC7738|nr:DUF6192 family protein [Streptomyces europaeiscabiei]MDX3781290.1 DUF6192 family protein [Streptomyces europaeiscabiei]MDX3834934.1 DUF6192 family protein [Streptomyces europaeiscabiei]
MANCPECGTSWTAGGTSRLGTLLLSPLPQTGLAQPERDTIARGLAQARAAADWIENAAMLGEVDLAEQLEKLLRSSGE